ncbi:RNA polymerase sigma factor SigY [Pontibacillus yanchengensis]|nr:RNA polymerase sigma factor SigY [Pontibacillus yanchengensis]
MEQDYLARAKKGDEEALASILKEHYTFVYKYVLKISGSEQTALDITQDTMVKAIQKIQQYKGKSAFSSWLIQIATNTYLDMKRKQKTAQSYLEKEKRKLDYNINNSFQSTEWHATKEAIWKLPDAYRIPILLKHYYGYDYAEIAKMTSVKVGTVKSRVHYGLAILREELQEHE